MSYKNKEKLVKKVSTKLAKVVTSTPTQEVAYTLDSYQIANWAIRAVVKKKVWGIGPVDKPVFKAYPNILKLLRDLKKDGVECKFLADVTKYDPRLLKKVAKYAEVRHWDKAFDLVLYIIDGNEVLLAIPAPKIGTFYTGFLLKHPSLIKLAEEYFNLKFKEGIPLEERIKELSKKQTLALANYGGAQRLYDARASARIFSGKCEKN